MNKKLILLAAVLLLLCTVSPASAAEPWGGTADTTWYGGGTIFTLTTAEQLAGLAKLVNDGTDFTGKDVTLGADIDLGGTHQWKPIGYNFPNNFKGSFDGGGFTIENLYINNETADYQGLFGVTDSVSIIKNVVLVEVNVTGKERVGGLVGQAYGSIENSYATGTVNGKDYVGGLVGYASGTITNSYATGTVNATGNIIGGLVGQVYGSIENSYATGTVNGSGFFVGGLVGWASGSIENSYATGTVTGKDYVGGLAGQAFNSIKNSYATGTVNATGDKVGGLVGSNNGGTITNSSALNRYVNGSTNVGRVVGSGTNLADNFAWDGMVSVNSSGDIGADKPNGANISSMYIWNTFPNGGVNNEPWTGWGTPWELNTNQPDRYKLPTLTGITNYSSLPDVSYLAPVRYFANGTGTAASPFEIWSESDLANLSIVTNGNLSYGVGLNYSEANYKVMADFPLSSYQTGPGWTPIGNDTSYFNGTFDGSGKTITELKISNSLGDYLGLFGYANSGAVIENVVLNGVNVTGNSSIGGVAGLTYGTIKNSLVTGTP